MFVLNQSYNFHTIDDLFYSVRNGFVGTATPYYRDKGIPYLQSNNIKNNSINTNQLVFISEDFHQKNKKSILKTGDILMVQSGHAGECAVVTKDFDGANCHALIVMSPNENTNSQYVSYYINSPIGQRRLHRLITGNTIKHILASDIKTFSIPIPPVSVQEKSVAFLSLIDQRIKKQQEKVEALREQKKGLLQKILDRELRFKDENGEEFSEWKRVKLSKALKIQNGFPFKSQYFNDYKDGMPLIRIRDLKSESLETYYSGEYDKSFIVNNNDILIGMDGEFNTCNWQKGPALLNQRVMKINALPGYDLNFLYQILTLIVKEIEYKTPQTTVKHLSNKDIYNFTIEIPCYDEQLKIGDFLDALDKLISLEIDFLNNLNQHKKALLQRMFI